MLGALGLILSLVQALLFINDVSAFDFLPAIFYHCVNAH